MRKITYRGRLIAIEVFGHRFYRNKEARELLKIFVEDPTSESRCQWVTIKRY